MYTSRYFLKIRTVSIGYFYDGSTAHQTYHTWVRLLSKSLASEIEPKEGYSILSCAGWPVSWPSLSGSEQGQYL